jgi:hypothetical protein
MRIERSAFLAGFAALALLAGTGFASAQETGNQQKAKQPHAAMQQMQKRHMAGKMSQNAQQRAVKPKMAAFRTGKTKAAQIKQRKPMIMAQHKAIYARTTAQRAQRKPMAMAQHKAMYGRTTAQRPHVTRTAMARRRGMASLQGYVGPPRHHYAGLRAKAAPRTLQLTEAQRARIRGMVMTAPWAHNVNFAVNVGAVVPRGSVNVMPLPPTLASLHRGWRGMEYFVYQGELVIVNPRTMRIVAVAPA